MNNIEIINLWKQYDEKLEKSLSINQKIITMLQQQKAKKALEPARNYNYAAIVIGLIYVVFVAYFIVYTNSFSSIFFKVSIAIHLLVSVAAIGLYIRQLVLIKEIDNSENVIQMQQKLASLQASILKIVGLCFLQLPVFSTWNITFKMIEENPFGFWLIQVPIVVLFTFAGIWLYKNIAIKNIDKKWFKILFCGSEWKAVMRSGAFLREIEHFEKS
ncbi:MAG: hypothetical protein V4541_10035 [Bacteroidota bacterium]